MTDEERIRITEALTDLAREAAPQAVLRPMYGGTVIELIPDVAASRIGGIYPYAGHVSLELARGAEMADPAGVLEGQGKRRRHIKLRGMDEVAAKGCAGFLARAIDLAG